MNTIRFFLAAALLVFLMNSFPALADDIDLYSTGTSGSTTIPNLMFVIDSSANSDANFGPQTTPCKYYDNTSPSLSGTQVLGNEQCALVNVVHDLPTRSDGTALVNLGITEAKDGHLLDFTPIDDKPSNAADAAGKTNRQYFIWKVQNYQKKTGDTNVSLQMQEAWAYLSGGNQGTLGVANNTGSISKLVFGSGSLANGCAGNFIATIGASPTSAHTKSPSEDGPSPLDLPTAINNDKLNQIPNPPTPNPNSRFTSAVASMLNTSIVDSSKENPTGREWARFMYQRGQYGVPAIITYSVDLLGSPPNSSMQTFWTDIATYGGGKPFTASNYNDIVQALLKILNEVQAVNSVFASASLPVSVNAQGTYLNQIYMGMFRPDANGLPRWLGNLKQYQFVYTPATPTAAASLTLSDSQNPAQPAIINSGTGFIQPDAISFWTSKNTSMPPDGPNSSGTYTGGGFWRNKPQGDGGGYDSQDGEVVEKGGVGQAIRTNNLHDDYTANAGTTNNPRSVLTYCPKGSPCAANLFDSSNLFSTTNIPATTFNPSYVRISSIVRSGTNATVTTVGSHGFSTGTIVTISGATPADYNVTQSITVPTGSNNTFLITGLTDYPTTLSQGAYTAGLTSATPSISSVALTTCTSAGSTGCTAPAGADINNNIVTVTTASTAGLTVSNNTAITGVLPTSPYSGTVNVASVPNSTTFTYKVPVTPNSPSQNSYTLQRSAAAITSIVSGKGTAYTVTAANSFLANDKVIINGNTTYAGSYTVSSPTSSTFQISISGKTLSNCASSCGTASYPAITIPAGNIYRTSSTATAATVTGLAAGALYNGQTITLSTTGANANESAYAPSTGTNTVTISCTNAGGTVPTCTTTSFTFPITTTPSTTALTTSSPTFSLSASSVTIPAGAISRSGSGTTATVTGVANSFADQQTISIGTNGTVYPNESAYTGTWKITCTPTSNCGSSSGGVSSGSFSFGPVTLTPTSPATGTMFAYSGSSPDVTTLVNWVRGLDNAGDEPSPDPAYSTINVRGSIHGDVLHARPAVINYGGTIGTVVFYGANDGMYRAINGNQPNATPSSIGSTVPGNELWSFVLPEFISDLTRLRDNSPVLQLSSTPPNIKPTPAQKTYFADGSTGVYQKLNTDGTTNDAYIYLSMRRGGNFIYALHVQDPTHPVFAWKINQGGLTTNSGTTASTDYAELGQTWSQPKVALVRGYANPVLIFGAGYDPAEDSEPPGTDNMGRGIFILDAITGKLVWRATVGASDGCSDNTSSTNLISSSTTCTKANMKWSIPSDLALIDVNGDGYVDRLYAPDTGGNIWRVDLEPNGYGATTTVGGVTVSANLPSSWKVTQLAALGCATGSCASGTTPRKFFYPPDMVPSTTYHAVLIGSGDREHLLKSNGSYSVVNRFYMVKDTNTGSSGTDLYTTNTEANLTDITPAGGVTTVASTTPYDNSKNGYYVTFDTGEKAVNGATTVAGYTYFATNTPATSDNKCATNLGIAKGYAITPLNGIVSDFVYSGGGLPPTTVAGVVNVNYTDSSGVIHLVQVPFCLGCGGNPNSTPTGGSAIAGSKPPITVPTNRRKRYWYIENR